MADKKYYWLKLQKDFFKRHDTRIVESMPNGEKYILFYLKLLLESIDHNGELRFSETIPYNEDMLSVITETDIDTVRSAVQVFIKLNLMEKWDNGTIFMNQVDKMLGCETEWAEKKRRYREAQKLTQSGQCPLPVPSKSDKRKSKRKSKRKNIYIYGKYQHVCLTNEEVEDLHTKFGKHKCEYLINLLDKGIQKKGYTYNDHYLAILDWEERDTKYKPPITLNQKQRELRPPDKCPVCKKGPVITVTYGAAKCMNKGCGILLNYINGKWETVA